MSLVTCHQQNRDLSYFNRHVKAVADFRLVKLRLFNIATPKLNSQHISLTSHITRVTTMGKIEKTLFSTTPCQNWGVWTGPTRQPVYRVTKPNNYDTYYDIICVIIIGTHSSLDGVSKKCFCVEGVSDL
jgi:hypothetical protein